MRDSVYGIVRSSLGITMLLAAGAAQQRPEPLQVLRRMEVAGAAAFDRDAIAGVLATDAATMRALQRPLDAEAAAVVAERVQELHRRGGYVEATARGDVDGGTLRVMLAAGQRHRCGAIHVAGNTAVGTGRLRSLLTAGDEARPAWTEGEFPASGLEAIRRRVLAVVGAAYREFGRHGAQVEVELQPDAGRLDLRVRIAGEGHEVRVQGLRLDGEEPAAREAVLAALRFTSGALATTALLDDLQRQLETTGRYFTVRPVLPDPVPATLEPLVFAVQLRPNAPAVGTIQVRDAEQLRRAIDTLLADVRAGRAVRVVLPVAGPLAWDDLQVLPGEITVAVGRDGIAVEVARLQVGTMVPVPAVLGLAADELVFGLGDQTMRWRLADAVALQFHVSTDFAPSGEATIRWGAGVHAHGGELFAATIHPGTAAHLLTRAQSVRRDGDELTLAFDGTSFRLAADGRVVGQRIDFVVDGRPYSIQVSPQPVTASLQRNPAAGEVEAAGREVSAPLPSALRELASAMVDTVAGDDKVRSLLRGVIEASATLPRAPAPPRERAAVPSLADGAPSTAAVIGGLAAMVIVDRHFNDDLAAIAAPFAAMLQGDSAAAGAGLRALATDGERGPLCLGIVSRLLGLLGNERAATSFRDLAAERWTFAAFYADAAGLAGNLPAFLGVPAHVGAHWRQHPDLQATFVDLPAGATGDLAAWRQGLERLWDAGGKDWLRARLLGP